MTKLITKPYNVFVAELFKEQFAATSDRYYLFIAEHSPFSDDLAPPTPNNTVSETEFSVKEKIIFGKQISADDVAMMVNKTVWTANTEYPKYDDSTSDLHLKDFFVVADEASNYHVFKCLNNLGTPSTSKPLLSETSADDISYIKVADDYQWKYMYTVSGANYAKFATENYLPAYTDANVAAAAVPGAIEAISVDFSGSAYNSYTSGQFSDVNIGGNTQIMSLASTASANADFYNNSACYIRAGTGAGELGKIIDYTVVGDTKNIILAAPFTATLDATSEYEITPFVTIEGDGANASARAIIDTTANSISKIEMVNRGSGYSYATATITGNTGVVNVSSNTAIVANSASVRAIISPPGGHGSNNFAELYATSIGVSISFSEDESGALPTTNDYRTIGIIKNPLLANVSLTISDASGTLADEMIVTQATTGATGEVSFANSTVVRLSNVQGTLETGYRIAANTGESANVATITGQNDYFDATTTFTIEITNQGVFSNGFSLDETITQDFATGKVFFANSTIVKATSVRGTFNESDISEDAFITGSTTGAIGKVTAIDHPTIVKNSGTVMYLENLQPIQRSNTQTETIKLILKF